MSGVVVVSPVVSLLFDDAGNAFLVNDGDTLASQKGVLLAGKEGSNIRLLKLDADGTVRVAASSLPLPTGAATEATLATLATESKLEAVRALLATIDSDTSILAGVDYATQTTLAAAKTVLDTIDAVLDTIYARQADKTQFTRLTDGTNDASVDANGRLLADAKVAKDAAGTSLVHLQSIDVSAGIGRLKTTIYTQDGDPVAFGAASSSLKNEFAKNGGSEDLLVNGSGTPVVFTYTADSTYDISLQEIRFVMASNTITFGTGYFGGISGPLTNGLLVEIVSDGNTIQIGDLERNENFISFASPGGWEWIVSNKDVMTSSYLVGGGIKLYAGTSDVVRVTVRDNLSSAALYFSCFVKGNLITSA